MRSFDAFKGDLVTSATQSNADTDQLRIGILDATFSDLPEVCLTPEVITQVTAVDMKLGMHNFDDGADESGKMELRLVESAIAQLRDGESWAT